MKASRFNTLLDSAAHTRYTRSKTITGEAIRFTAKGLVVAKTITSLAFNGAETLFDATMAGLLTDAGFDRYNHGTSLKFTKAAKFIWKDKVISKEANALMIARLAAAIEGKFADWRKELTISDPSAAEAIRQYAMHDGKRKRNDALEQEALALRTKGTDGKWDMKKVEAYELWLANIR